MVGWNERVTEESEDLQGAYNLLHRIVCRCLRNPDISTKEEWIQDQVDINVMVVMAEQRMKNLGFKPTWYDDIKR